MGSSEYFGSVNIIEIPITSGQIVVAAFLHPHLGSYSLEMSIECLGKACSVSTIPGILLS